MTRAHRHPISDVLDLLGRRWALRVLWELRGGPLTFRALRERCGGVSPSVLNVRLAELRATGLVEASADAGYAISAEGRRLGELLAPLTAFASRWAEADPRRVAAVGAAAAGRGPRRRAGRA